MHQSELRRLTLLVDGREPDYHGAIQHALIRLEQELPPTLIYHSARHTRDVVLPAVMRLAALSGIGPEESALVQVAAAYHDIGMIEGSQAHEERGVRAVEDTLPLFGFSRLQIADVSDMIRATRLPQFPRDLLAAILSDADLDALGSEDFWQWTACLRAELAIAGQVIGDEEWHTQQLAFLRGHAYFTEAARALRDAGKQANIEILERGPGPRMSLVGCGPDLPFTGQVSELVESGEG
jgi:hypothetical protein